MQVIKQKIIDLSTAVVTYRSEVTVGAGLNSNLLEIPLLGASQRQRNLGFVEGPELDGEVNIIQLLGISASCASDDWDLRVLTVDDITQINTINEVLFYEEIEYSFSDFTFSNFFIQNNDTPEVPKLYARVTNDGMVDSGLITVVLVYKPIYF